LQTIEEVHIAQ